MARILADQGDSLADRFGVRFQIVAVNDFKLGSLYHPDGLPLEPLLAAAAGGDLTSVPAALTGWPVETMLAQSNADTLVEASFTNLESGEPAFSYYPPGHPTGPEHRHHQQGAHRPAFPGTTAQAKTRGVRLGFEGTVMSGTPAVFLGRNLLAAAGIRRIQGILNGTTNFILTRMEAGADYAEALAEAQALGYAEADPTGDVEGHDAAGKVVILSNTVLGRPLTLDQVDCQGITALTPADIRQAQAEGARWKLIGTLEPTQDGLIASVRPTKIPLSHPLASVSGATNAITYTTDCPGRGHPDRPGRRPPGDRLRPDQRPARHPRRNAVDRHSSSTRSHFDFYEYTSLSGTARASIRPHL